MSSSSYQPSAVSPIGPSTSSTSTRNSKLDQIIQNFYTKTAQIVIQARCTPDNDARYGRRTGLKGSSSTKKLNKWFNIATEDVEILREDLKFWRTMAIQSDKAAPPMIIDIYLDTSKLSHNQSLLVADDNLRWSCVELKSQTTDSHINRILIESWELTLNQPFPDYAVDLPNLYKRSIVFFRSLHSLARLLPSYDLYRKLQKLNDSSNPLSIGYRLSTSSSHQNNNEISLGSTILESDARKPTKVYEFSNIVTPIGTFKLNVTYRRNCDFRVEDTERDLSAQFIDMDEQFFTPTMAKYQQQEQLKRQSPKRETPRKNTTRPASMFSKSSTTPSSLESKLENALYDEQKVSIDPRDIRQHTSSGLKMTPYTGSGASSIRNLSPTNSTPTSRRASAPFVVSPFKSPFLSSSPQTDSIFAGSGGSNKNYIPTSSDRSRPVAGTSGNNQESGSYGKKIEFSSSFDKYKSSPTNRTTTSDSPSSISMMRRWSRASDHSSINIKTEHDEHDDLEEFVKLVGSNQELRMFQQPNRSTQLLSSTSESNSSTSSMMIGASTTNSSKKTALSHFQNLRETHNSLSESLSSSMMMNASQHHEPVSGVSPVSSTSSTGRSYQPIIPSPLHAEQKSTSPVHIPRSLPQFRSFPQHTLRLARLNPAKEEETDQDENDDDDDDDDQDTTTRHHRIHDMSAFSTYPQGNHHPHADLHILRNASATTGHSKLNTPNSDRHPTMINRSSLLDDDDSLVFKMSELECEGPPPPLTPPTITMSKPRLPTTISPPGANNNRVNEQFLELTPTPLSPPLLQAISMSSSEQEKKTLEKNLENH